MLWTRLHMLRDLGIMVPSPSPNLRQRSIPVTRLAMNQRKHASALLALLALLLIPAACKDKTPPPRPHGAAVPIPLAPPADAASPDSFRVKFLTTKGDFTVEVTRAWAPKGADRFYRLVTDGYFKDIRFFRVLPGFMAQFGMSGNPALNAKMDSLRIPDDPVTQSNKRGMVTFATAGPNTRSSQFFINYKDNSSLDLQGFSPFGKVVDGMKTVDAMYSGYGEGAPNGSGPSQDSIRTRGNEYLQRAFPKLDYIKSATIVK
jgi:peptidyl-prolyl cis-trans isomerase A (cyclophilin A)